jgi:uncharacterized protein (TIGR03118 family)
VPAAALIQRNNIFFKVKMTFCKKTALTTLLAAGVMAISACSDDDGSSTSQASHPAPASAPPASGSSKFKATVLVSSTPGTAPNTDPNLENGWGIAFKPTGEVWVSDNSTGKSSLYEGVGIIDSLVVAIPSGQNSPPAGPTGVVFNGTADFAVTQNGKTSPGSFIFAALDGTISAWAPTVAASSAVIAFDNGAGHAVYTGLAIASNGAGNLLYAADFNNGKVDVFDKNFKKVVLDGKFEDSNLPAHFSPFGIQALGGNIFVSYAQQNPNGGPEEHGAGLGYVDEFDTSGHFLKRIGTQGTLNAPWGMVIASANFGSFSNDLLIGNFGDGTINAFDPNTGAFLGQLVQQDGTVLTVPGLWGIAFGNGFDNQPVDTLFFAAGPTPTSGNYGSITLAPGG